MHALAINFNATFLFRSLLLVVNSSMKYQIYTKCIVLWYTELKFSSSWSFFETCVKYMYWYYKTLSIIQRNWNIYRSHHSTQLEHRSHHSTQFEHCSDFSVKPRNRSALYAKSRKNFLNLTEKTERCSDCFQRCH